jgi:hypothetical protein
VNSFSPRKAIETPADEALTKLTLSWNYRIRKRPNPAGGAKFGQSEAGFPLGEPDE